MSSTPANPLYYRAIMVERGEFPPVGARDRVLGRRAIRVGQIGDDGAYCHVKLQSEAPPPPYLESLVKSERHGNTVLYTYDVCVADTIIADHAALILAGPTRRVLSELRPPNLLFVRFNLERICDDQFSSRSDPRVTLARVHARIYGEKGEAVKSITFYGRDVLKSQALRDVLRGMRIAVDSPPFVRMLGSRSIGRRLEIQSCRLLWEDGESLFPLNIDKFGNLSFRFDGALSLLAVSNLLRYAADVQAAEITTADPTKRSEAALRAVQS